MNVQVKSSNGIFLVPMETRLLGDRKIFIEGEITQEKACEFVKKMLVLCKEDSNSPIDILISSEGGEILAGMLMYDCIQSCRTPLRMFCLGTAYSMGALLFASGNQRFMLPHSELMLHEPLIGSRIGGSASSIRSVSESLTETKNKINRILAKHTGRTQEEIEEATRFDHYFSPEESIAFGLADEIVNFETIMEG